MIPAPADPVKNINIAVVLTAKQNLSGCDMEVQASWPRCRRIGIAVWLRMYFERDVEGWILLLGCDALRLVVRIAIV